MPRYDAAFWKGVADTAGFHRLMGTLKRLVENQAQKVTLRLTDTLSEHELLEELIDASKPPARHPRLARLDYLLRTPWRYPPLPWGSRFGARFEPSLFYGALGDTALFAEAAYYRFVFLEGMATPFRERVLSQFTVFEAAYRTEAGVDLTRKPFENYTAVLRHPEDYGPCQALGSVLRERGAGAILYYSARTREPACNVALYTPDALRSRRHRNPRPGVCDTRHDEVSFRYGKALITFPRSHFLVEGRLPIPA